MAALDDKALVAASSASLFARGKTYAQSGAVAVTDEDPMPEPALRAQISGTERYTVEVRMEDDGITGECDCMHAAEGWFCKHQVALALVWRQRLTGEEPEFDEVARKKVAASAKRAQTVKSQGEALRSFLHAQDAAALADKLLELAALDSSLKRALHGWQKISSARDDPAQLRSAITELMAAHGFLNYHQSRSYARRAAEVLPLLERARKTDAAAGLTLALHALRRCWRAMEHADDSDGEIGDLCHAIGDAVVAALQAAGPQPEKFGKTWLDLIDEDPFGCLDHDAAESAMGAKALAHLRKLIAESWQRALDAAMTSRSKGKRRDTYIYDAKDPERVLAHYQRQHLAQLEAAGDIPGCIAVLKATLYSDGSHFALIDFLERHGLHREAFAAAETAYKLFPDDWRIESALLACYQRDGWHKEALALLTARFDRRPSLEHYSAVLAAGPAAGTQNADLREAMLGQLLAREAAQFAAEKKRPGAHHSAGYDISARLEIYCAEEYWADAIAALQSPAYCNRSVMHTLALKLPVAHKAEALRLLKSLFSSEMRNATSPYRNALELVAQISERLSEDERSAWLTTLRVEYKAKRNFVAGLAD